MLPKLKYAPESSNHHVIVTRHTSNFRGKFLHHLQHLLFLWLNLHYQMKALKNHCFLKKYSHLNSFKYKKSKAKKTVTIFYMAKKKQLIHRTNTSVWIKYYFQVYKSFQLYNACWSGIPILFIKLINLPFINPSSLILDLTFLKLEQDNESFYSTLSMILAHNGFLWVIFYHFQIISSSDVFLKITPSSSNT